jgi:hypothetical protein
MLCELKLFLHQYTLDVFDLAVYRYLIAVRADDLAPHCLAIYQDLEFDAFSTAAVGITFLDVQSDSEIGAWNRFNECCCLSGIVLYSVFDGILATDTDGDTSARKAIGAHSEECAVRPGAVGARSWGAWYWWYESVAEGGRERP